MTLGMAIRPSGWPRSYSPSVGFSVTNGGRRVKPSYRTAAWSHEAGACTFVISARKRDGTMLCFWPKRLRSRTYESWR